MTEEVKDRLRAEAAAVGEMVKRDGYVSQSHRPEGMSLERMRTAMVVLGLDGVRLKGKWEPTEAGREMVWRVASRAPRKVKCKAAAGTAKRRRTRRALAGAGR